MSEKFDLIIKGNIVLPEKIVKNGFLAVKKEKIVGIFNNNENLEAEKFLDVSGKLVLPGIVDAHVHSFSSLKEGFINASRSAAAAGVTTIVEMPYDADDMVNSEKALLRKKQRIPSESMIDVALLATLRNSEDSLKDVELLTKHGICGFKLSIFNTDPVRFPGIKDGLLFEMFREIAGTNLPVGVHAENDDIIRTYIKKYENSGLNNPIAHCKSRPKAAEAAAVVTALELARHSGVHLHIYHASYPEIFELVDFYKKSGVKTTAETCPHYLVLNTSDMKSLGAKAKINPPIREKQDSEGLWEVLNSGKADIVTSDHAPWTIDRKNNPDIFKNASGVPGVETLLPIVYSEGVTKDKISIFQMVKLLCQKPAEIFGINHCKGRIETGYDADFAIIDPNETYTLDEKQLHSTAGWSPYNGFNLQGRIKYTVLRGKIIYSDGEFKEHQKGKFIPVK